MHSYLFVFFFGQSKGKADILLYYQSVRRDTRILNPRVGWVHCQCNATFEKQIPLGIRTMEVLEWNPHRAFRMDKLTIADVERMAREE